jgi:hydrogenase maturation protein HypF
MARVRCELRVRGAVQGVGFRPWAAARARQLGLAGAARNDPEGVALVLEGPAAAVEGFLAALRAAPPEGARIEAVERRAAAPRGSIGFAIEASLAGPGAALPRVPLDVPVCERCLAELFDPGERRHRYAFTHCAACGPRASVLAALPWDRERSALAAFPSCGACRAEYDDEEGRRHHAESIACPACGPRLRAAAPGGAERAGDALEHAAEALRGGGIVALKGYGGFHLACDARSAKALAVLRARKGRPAKPFAVLLPDLAAARRVAELAPADEALLAGPMRALVLAPRRRAGCAELGLAEAVAPGLRDLGLLLPCAPLHWLLLFAPGTAPGRDPARFPALVLTSANASAEPTLHRSVEAAAALRGLADVVVDHDREVLRPSDDPVFRSAPSGPIPVRLSRGSAPLVLPLPGGLRARAPVVALGGELKCAPALAAGSELLLGEHVGDLASAAAADAARARIADLARLAGAVPAIAAHDLHPGGVGAELARGLAPRCAPVQHHHAHAVACLLEHGRSGPALALALDGLGYGGDGTLWGGELLAVDVAGFERLAHLEAVPLPGGDAAAREPWRMAAVWLARAFPEGAPNLAWHGRRDPARLAALLAIASRARFAPPTSSCGRLFDAVASLLDLADEVSHEAEAALALESAASEAAGAPFALAPFAPPREGTAAATIEVAPLVRELVLARSRGAGVPALATAFHEGLAARLAAAAAHFAERVGLRSVVLTGGCFQNRLLLEALRARLAAAGLEPLTHGRLPPGDGGLAAGQAVVAVAREAGVATRVSLALAEGRR